MINTLISISVPGIAPIMMQAIMNFVYFDLFIMENWFSDILEWINGKSINFSDDKPLNEYFDENGYSSKIFLNNIGSGLIFLVIYLLLWSIALLMNKIGNFFAE